MDSHKHLVSCTQSNAFAMPNAVDCGLASERDLRYDKLASGQLRFAAHKAVNDGQAQRGLFGSAHR